MIKLVNFVQWILLIGVCTIEKGLSQVVTSTECSSVAQANAAKVAQMCHDSSASSSLYLALDVTAASLVMTSHSVTECSCALTVTGGDSVSLTALTNIAPSADCGTELEITADEPDGQPRTMSCTSNPNGAIDGTQMSVVFRKYATQPDGGYNYDYCLIFYVESQASVAQISLECTAPSLIVPSVPSPTPEVTPPQTQCFQELQSSISVAQMCVASTATGSDYVILDIMAAESKMEPEGVSRCECSVSVHGGNQFGLAQATHISPSQTCGTHLNVTTDLPVVSTHQLGCESSVPEITGVSATITFAKEPVSPDYGYNYDYCLSIYISNKDGMSPSLLTLTCYEPQTIINPSASPTTTVSSTIPSSPTAMVSSTIPFSPTAMVSSTIPSSPTATVSSTIPSSPTAMVSSTIPSSPTAMVSSTIPSSPTAMVSSTIPSSPTAMVSSTPSSSPTTTVLSTPSSSPTTTVSSTIPSSPTTMVSSTPSSSPTSMVSSTPSSSPTTTDLSTPSSSPTTTVSSTIPSSPTTMVSSTTSASSTTMVSSTLSTSPTTMVSYTPPAPSTTMVSSTISSSPTTMVSSTPSTSATTMVSYTPSTSSNTISSTTPTTMILSSSGHSTTRVSPTFKPTQIPSPTSESSSGIPTQSSTPSSTTLLLSQTHSTITHSLTTLLSMPPPSRTSIRSSSSSSMDTKTDISRMSSSASSNSTVDTPTSSFISTGIGTSELTTSPSSSTPETLTSSNSPVSATSMSHSSSNLEVSSTMPTSLLTGPHSNVISSALSIDPSSSQTTTTISYPSSTSVPTSSISTGQTTMATKTIVSNSSSLPSVPSLSSQMMSSTKTDVHQSSTETLTSQPVSSQLTTHKPAPGTTERTTILPTTEVSNSTANESSTKVASNRFPIEMVVSIPSGILALFVFGICIYVSSRTSYEKSEDSPDGRTDERSWLESDKFGEYADDKSNSLGVSNPEYELGEGDNDEIIVHTERVAGGANYSPKPGTSQDYYSPDLSTSRDYYSQDLSTSRDYYSPDLSTSRYKYGFSQNSKGYLKNGGLYSDDQDNDHNDSMDRYSENYNPLDYDSKHSASSRIPSTDGVLIKHENSFDVVEDETGSKRHSRREDAALAMVKILMENGERLDSDNTEPINKTVHNYYTTSTDM